RRAEERRRQARREDLRGVRVEGEDDRLPVERGGARARQVEQALVADVHAVEVADGDDRRTQGRARARGSGDDQHAIAFLMRRGAAASRRNLPAQAGGTQGYARARWKRGESPSGPRGWPAFAASSSTSGSPRPGCTGSIRRRSAPPPCVSGS